MSPSNRMIRSMTATWAIVMLLATLSLQARAAPGTQWYRMRTPHFDILFPAEFAREAKRVANTLEHIYKPVSKSLDLYPKKITLVLRNQYAVANGVTTSIPRKVEFFTFPTQDYSFLGVNDWLDLLAMHEFRHVVQFERLAQKFNHNVPLWFFEGDAVGTETALSKGGRGRAPHFGLLYKTNLLERGGFSYQKQVCRSFKHQIPDHYRIGYFLTTHLRRKYGADVLDRIIQRIGFFSSFATAVKKVTGQELTQVYQDANQELLGYWRGQLKDLKLSPATRIHAREEATYTDYLYPQPTEQGIIVLQAGIGTVAHFALIDEQQRIQKIFIPGYIDQSAGLSVAQGKLVWVECKPDIRWKDRAYSVIQLYDIQTKQLKTLTHKSRYGAAALSPDAAKIVALESDEAYNHQLVIIDAEEGQVLHRLPNPANHFYLTPRWSADGQHIVAIKHVNQKTTISLINPTTGVEQDLLPHTTESIGHPVMIGQYVFYNSTYSGIDNIYAIDLQTQRRFQVTSRKYGAYSPSISADGQWIFFNDFTRDGMDVMKMPLDPQHWLPLEKVEDRSVRYYEPLVKQENNADLLKHIPAHAYQTEVYQPWKHLVNIQKKLVPFSDPYGSGIGIYSEVVLNTAEWIVMGYSHNSERDSGRLLTRFAYQGWYPVIDVAGNVTMDYRPYFRYGKGIWYNKELSVGARIPLVWIRGQYTHGLTLGTAGKMYWEHNANRAWRIQTYGASFFRAAKESFRDIYPPWAQKFWVHHEHTPYGGPQVLLGAAKFSFYFPGLSKHHSLRLATGYQYKSPSSPYQLKQSICPRGHEGSFMQELYGMRLNYTFPIGYPDWELGTLLYIKRFSTNLFYDYAHIPAINSACYSWGADLLMNFHILADFIPLEIGVRCVYTSSTGKYSFSPLIGIGSKF